MSPLTEATFVVLLTLVPGARHGYAIMQDVTELSEKRVNLSTGTLYTILKRLLDDHWIEPVEEADAPRGRKTYRLTLLGRTIVHEETARITAVSAVARRQLGDAQ